MKVFISSTFKDLEQERDKLHKALKKAGFESLGMEFFGAQSGSPEETCLAEIEDADLILLISANSYGSIDEKTGKSYTHLEFETAKKCNIKTLAFLQDSPTNDKTKAFHDEIVNSQITVDFFHTKSDIPSVVFPALFNYIIENGYIKNKSRTFNDFTQFYSKSFQEESLFNYNQKFIGRGKELATLDDFLSDPKQKLSIVSAAGGIGKSKLIYEFTQKNLGDSAWHFNFVPSQIGFDNNSLVELPSNDCCIIIEDAHKQRNLDSLIYSLLNQFPHKVKIIITTRPSGLKSVKESLRDYNPCKPLELQRLSKDDSIELAKSLLGTDKQHFAEQIEKSANGNTLVVVIASELIKKELLEDTIIKDRTFKDKVLDRLLSELDKVDNKGLDLRKLLTVISGLSPFVCDSNSMTELSEYFKLEQNDLVLILDELQKHGFIVKIGNRLRVIPDILADHILYDYSVNLSNQPTGFIEILLEKFGRQYFDNILVNVSGLDYVFRKINLANCIWESIGKKVSNCNFQELTSILKSLEKVAYFAPEKVFNIVDGILKGNVRIKEDEKEASKIYDFRSLVNLTIRILGKLGHRQKYTKKACHLLWEIASNPDLLKWLDNFSENPILTFKKMASFNDNNPLSVQNEAMDCVKEIIENAKHIKNENKICDIIESPLGIEIENNTYSKRSLSISWFCVFEISNDETKQKVILAREKALELYSFLVDNSEDTSLYSIAKNLCQKLFMPYYRGKELPSGAMKEITKESKIALDIIKKIIAKKIPVLNNAIYEFLENKENRLLDNISISHIIPAELSNQQDLLYCIRHDYPIDYSDDIEETDKRFNLRQEQTAKQLWKDCKNNPKQLLDTIIDYRTKLEEYGIKSGDFTFLIACAKIKPELCQEIIEIIISEDRDDYLSSTINMWLQNAPQEQQLCLAESIINDGNPCHRASIARGLSQLEGLSENQLVKIIETLSNDKNPEVKDSTIRRLGITCYHRKIDAELPRIIDVLCDYDTQNDAIKLEMIFDNLNPRWISPDILSDRQICQLLEKIKNVKKLAGHDIGDFLSNIISKKPLECVEIFLWRIKNKSSSDEQIFPYNGGFHKKPSDVLNHPDYDQCLIKILEAMKEYEWKSYFWCPTIIQWLDPTFSEKTKQTLLRNIHLHNNCLKAISYIFVGYEREIFFSNIDFINTLLTESLGLSNQDEKMSIQGKLSFMPFSGARYIPGLGQDDDLCISIIEKCNEILTDGSLTPNLISFYEDLGKYAENQNKEKLERDQIELQEEDY